MAPTKRFVINFMLLSTLALLNILVYVYFTHPALLNVRTLGTQRPRIEVSRLHQGEIGTKADVPGQANNTSKIQPLDNKETGQHEQPANQGGQILNPDAQLGNHNGQPVNQNGQPAQGGQPPNQYEQLPNLIPVNTNEQANQGLIPNPADPEQEETKPKKIVMPHDYRLVINQPEKCLNPDGSKADVFLLVLVNSVHKNFEQRQAIRDTWGSLTMMLGHRIITLFMLANVHDDNLQNLVQQESAKHGDILMESFDDTYKNLTLKSIMGFKWATNYCSHARFGMKTDDDMYISYENIVKFLINAPDRKLAVGYLINGAPIRDPKSKWFMPRETYPGNRYPPFLSGTGYVMSLDVIRDTYEISIYTPFLYLEDVYVGTCWEQIGVIPVKHPEFHNWKKMYQLCRYRSIMTAHMVTPNEMYRIWRDMASKKHIMCPKSPRHQR